MRISKIEETEPIDLMFQAEIYCRFLSTVLLLCQLYDFMMCNQFP